MSPPAPVSRAGAQRAANHELAKAIYHRHPKSLVDRGIDAVGRFLDHLLTRAVSHTPAGDFGALAVVVIIAIVVALVVWRVGVPQRKAELGGVLIGGTATTAAEHRRLAITAAAGADWKTAIIERMRAIARELEERSVLAPRAGRTATELAHEASGQVPRIATEISEAAEIFNDVAYGAGRANPDRLAVMIRADDSAQESGRSHAVAQ